MAQTAEGRKFYLSASASAARGPEPNLSASTFSIAGKTRIFTMRNLFRAAHYSIKTLSYRVSNYKRCHAAINYVASYSASTRAPAAKLKRRVVMTRAHFLALTNALAG